MNTKLQCISVLFHLLCTRLFHLLSLSAPLNLAYFLAPLQWNKHPNTCQHFVTWIPFVDCIACINLSTVCMVWHHWEQNLILKRFILLGWFQSLSAGLCEGEIFTGFPLPTVVPHRASSTLPGNSPEEAFLGAQWNAVRRGRQERSVHARVLHCMEGLLQKCRKEEVKMCIPENGIRDWEWGQFCIFIVQGAFFW